MTQIQIPDSVAEMDVAGRLPRLLEAMGAAEVDTLLVTHLTNIGYLTGFTGSAALLLVRPEGTTFVTDGRYRDQSAEQIARAGVTAEVVVPADGEGQRKAIAEAAKGARRLGLEAEHVSWAAQRRYTETWFEGVELVPTEDLVEGLRLVKDEGELARISKACLIADAALASIRHRLDEEPTEAELAAELDAAMRGLGAADISFDTIVAAGPNGARPHATPGPRRIVDGDLVVMDFGALVDGYHSDMTRTFQVGEVSDTQRRMWDVVAASQAAGVAAVRPGVTVGEVDLACREVIDAAGWGEAFLHSTGHGVGLDIHESPRVAKAGDATLDPGLVVTVEPGVYLPEHGGVRIEDTLVVTEEGARVLTTTAITPAP